jgi:hypothetical protein
MTSEFIIDYDNRSAGSGKTFDQLTRIAANYGRYLFATDRRSIIQEREATLHSISRDADVIVTSRRVHASMDEDQDMGGSVRVSLEALPNTYTSGHVVVWVTHTGLENADLSKFGGWNLVIDETPSLLDRETLYTGLSCDLLASMFELEPYGEFRRIVPASKCSSTRAIAIDTLAAPLATLHSRVTSGRSLVLTHLRSWDELKQRPRWTWWSLWSPAALASFETVTILAAAFDKSLTYELCRKRNPEIGWRAIEALSPALSAPRTLTIRYFADAHGASRSLFGSSTGKSYLAKIAAYLAAEPGEMIWTCNGPERAAMRQRLRTGYLSPRQAGSNAWSHVDRAAIVYTSKPDLHERKLLKSMDVDPVALIETRERDTIYQFIGRTSLRDRGSTRDVVAYVYDEEQAAAVAMAFGADPGISVCLELVDLGFAHQHHGRSSTPELTSEQKAARVREQARLRKQKQRAANKGRSEQPLGTT